MIHVEFAPADCTPCPSRPSCTCAKSLPRSFTLQPKEEHEAIQSARKRQQTEEFASLYSSRAGIEGTVSQGVRSYGLRRARYRGLRKTHLQHLATAAAINVGRMVDWLSGFAYRDHPALALRGSGSGELIAVLWRIIQQCPLRTQPKLQQADAPSILGCFSQIFCHCRKKTRNARLLLLRISIILPRKEVKAAVIATEGGERHRTLAKYEKDCPEKFG